MKFNSQGSIHRYLTTSLIVFAALVPAQPVHAKPAPLAQTNISQSSSNQPDLKAMIERAEKLRMEGDFGAAGAIWQEILVNVESTLGPNHPDLTTRIENLAEFLSEQGRYAAAELFYRRSLVIREKVLGQGHPDVATRLNNLASLLYKQGQHAAAEPLYRRAQAIYEKKHGPDHPTVAAILNNLAVLLGDQGQYSAAEPLYRRSLAIREKALGPNHPDVATSLNNLAGLLVNQGQYSVAEPLYRRSLVIHEKALGPNHPAVATSLNNLAFLLSHQNQYAAAETLQHRSLTIHEKALGPDHPSVSNGLNNLAVLLEAQGRHAAAEPLYRRSLAIHEKALGPDHPDVATTLNNLALLLYFQGHLTVAEPLYRRSLAIREKSLGPYHPDVANSLNSLAALANEQRRYEDAIPILGRSRNIEITWLLRELPLLPAQARSTQLRRFGDAWQLPFSWISYHPSFTQLSLETRLNRQGLLPEIEQRQALLLNAPGVDLAKVEQLQDLTQQLSSITLPSDRRAEVREQRNKLQSEIYRQIPQLELKLVTTAEVARVLPADGVLVEFQRYRPFDGRKSNVQGGGEAQYIALVLKPDASVASVPLGPAAAIDSTVHQGLRATADGLSDADAIWGELSDQVLKPLLPHLTGIRQWFLSPDGELNRVPFAALPAPQQPGTRLAQIVQLRLLTTGRELVKLQQSTPTGGASLVMANPTYDRLGAKPAQESKATEVTAVAQKRSAELGSNKWKQLPASEREGQRVAKLLSTGLISGTSATTKALQRHQGPLVLHVATHGFFVADQETKPTEPMRAIQEGSPLLRSLRQEDPQLRSGLVFAGANQPDLDPKDDGYLTAAEAVNLNLKGTELVVLSACSTGQGEVRTGEGVYGLQRSLTVAGSRSTLLSLWKVDDAATAEFMSRFYQRLKAGEGRSDALAAVQEEFRSGKVQSANGLSWKEPYYWAAWQLVGDWRPIPDL
jgi:CHAT domain-containing protein/tetratricopeptide (TPR) repeat protein